MRLHAPVPLIGREIEKELDLDGVRLPAGTNVQVSIIGVHNNPAVWGSDVTVLTLLYYVFWQQFHHPNLFTLFYNN